MTNLSFTKKTYDHHHGTDIDKKGCAISPLRTRCPSTEQTIGSDAVVRTCLQGSTGPSWTGQLTSGPGRAAKALQRAVGAFEDGAIGPQTLMAVQASQPEEIINRMAVHRDSYYRSLSTFDTFGRGWLRRNDETREQALEMGRG